MPGNPHIVRRVQKRRIDCRFLPDQAPNKVEVTRVAATNTMLTEYPDVANLVRGETGVSGMTSSSGSALPFRMTSNSPVEKPVTERSKSRSMDRNSVSSNFSISTSQRCPERDLVIGDPQCALLRLGQPSYLNGWDLGESHGIGSRETGMAGDNATVGIGQNGVYEAELSNGRDELVDLLFGVRPRIARIRSKRAHCAVGHRKRRDPTIRGNRHGDNIQP